MFGLHNYSGSCWVNACLQGIFRIPDLQLSFQKDSEIVIQESLRKIYNSNGSEGLVEFFKVIDHKDLLAGRTIGDSHELLIYLLDKLPWLEDLCKFQTCDKFKCSKCDYESLKEDTKIEISLFPNSDKNTILECLENEIKEENLEDSKCEKCQEKLTKQLLFKNLPKILIIHVYNHPKNKTDYSSSIIINSKKYILLSALCFNGGHWNCIGRHNNLWHLFDDTNIRSFKENEFPVSSLMRVLIYYQE